MTVSSGPLEVWIAPGHRTALTFDVPLARDGVTLEGPGREFVQWELAERRVLLEPTARLPREGEHLLLRVTFADGLTPRSATFVLRTSPSTVDSRVTVTRQRLTAGELLVELNETRAQLDAARQELLALRSRSGPASLGALLMAAGFEPPRVDTGKFHGHIIEGAGLKLDKPISFHHLYDRLVLLLPLRNQDATSPWKPGGVHVVPAEGQRPLELMSVTLDRPQLAPGEAGLLMLELPWPSQKPRPELSRIDLQDAVSGRRAVWEATWWP